MLRSCFVLFAFCLTLSIGYDIQCRFDEELRCVNSCPPQKTCRNKDVLFGYTDENENCTYKCVCKEGYARNSLGDCISYEQCDKCKGENEFFACNIFCDNVCSLLHTQSRTNCHITSAVCNPKCYCDDDYARDENQKCIPIEKCPPPPTCGVNEEYSFCKWGCTSLFDPGCTCKPGFIKLDEDSPCIPQRE